MKKILISIITLLFIVGCGCEEVGNSPTKQVDDLMYKYQTVHASVATQLENVVNNEPTFTDEQKKNYREVMERQFKDLKYEIKEEIVDGDDAIVTVEIEVYDYAKILRVASDYLISNPTEFNDDEGNYSDAKFNDYKIELLGNTKEKITYTINIDLTKTEKSWDVNPLSDVALRKIFGLYSE